MVRVIAFEELSKADLVIDAVYEGGSAGHAGDDPINKVLPGVGNQGGFRDAGRGDDKKFVVLYTSGEDSDWPDDLDLNTGQFVYYGDNKTPGHELHDTGRGGNRLLRRVFDKLHAVKSDRAAIPPFFVFKKYPTPRSTRSVQFVGLAAPGFRGLPATSDLVAVWKTSDGQRFQNYRAVFTMLNVPVVKRAWLDDLVAGSALTENAPAAWCEWLRFGRYQPLAAESTTVIRSQEAQTPDTRAKIGILRTVWKHFKEAPRAFEFFAARLFQMHDPRVIIDEITRASVDGGRDAIGRYLLGLNADPVYAEFSLEAKCYAPGIDGMTANTVGVKEVSRLISRIRHRQFGVLVTTSVVARQAYEEVRDDRHPIIFLAGKDITDILTKTGYGTPELVENLLRNEFAVDPP
jgi:Restriction endonuclease AspBHI N-terminal/Restriction endonuclease